MEIQISFSKEENEQIKKNKDILKIFKAINELELELDGLYWIKTDRSIFINLQKQESLKLIKSIKFNKFKKFKLNIITKLINKLDED